MGINKINQMKFVAALLAVALAGEGEGKKDGEKKKEDYGVECKEECKDGCCMQLYLTGEQPEGVLDFKDGAKEVGFCADKSHMEWMDSLPDKQTNAKDYVNWYFEKHPDVIKAKLAAEYPDTFTDDMDAQGVVDEIYGGDETASAYTVKVWCLGGMRLAVGAAAALAVASQL